LDSTWVTPIPGKASDAILVDCYYSIFFPIYGKIKNVPNHQPVMCCKQRHFFRTTQTNTSGVGGSNSVGSSQGSRAGEIHQGRRVFVFCHSDITESTLGTFQFF